MSLQFWLTTLVVVASPGIGVVYTLAAGLSRGARASLVAAFGCTLGIVPHVAAALLGLAAILHASALAFAAVKYAGVAYLLFLAWCAWREGGALRVERVEDRRSDVRIVVDAILVNVLNPKLSIFFVAFLPQFISSGEARPLVAHARAFGGVHGGDLRRVRALRNFRRGRARPRDRPAAHPRLAQAQLRCGLRRAGGAARADGKMRRRRRGKPAGFGS